MLFIGHAVIGQQVRLESRPAVTVGQLRAIPIKGSQSPHAVPGCQCAANKDLRHTLLSAHRRPLMPNLPES
jgi:hypothetical protein